MSENTNIPQVRVGVGVAVNVEGQGLFLLQRRGSHGAGEWSFPGGHLEFGESVIQCAIREVMEETGLILENAEIIPIFTEDSYPGKQYITLYVYATARGEPIIMEPEKASDMMFLNFGENLPNPLFAGVEKIFTWFNQTIKVRQTVAILKAALDADLEADLRSDSGC